MLGKTIVNRYKILDEFFQDSLTVIYKAQDLSENKPVFFQILKEKTKERPLETLLRFKRLQDQLFKFDHPNLLKIYSHGEFDSQNYVVYEYFGFNPLLTYLGQPLLIDTAVEIILQISSALDLAHQNGILHQALQPQSIFVTQDLKITKLSNFGYNLLNDISSITEAQEIIFTFGYLSPESSGILRKPVDARSDIYSLGIVFYQLVTGRLPYTATDVATLIHQHIAQQPASPSSINNKMPPVIDKIILRLIAKEPQERYQSLSGLLVDLREYQRLRREGKEFIDFEIARVDRLAQLSFSTRLIGRDKEFEQLKGYLERTKDSKGAFCNVFGEPGIGKSRLVDELRGHIHSLNGLFCGGKCYQYEFRTPYKVFSEAIDAYIDKVKRLEHEKQEAHITRIKETLGELGGEVVKIAPAITDLIGEPPKLVELEPEKEKIRFFITVTNFLTSLATHDAPLLMFLDDLQWVDDGSLEILERLAEKIGSTSLVLIVGYRDTEVDNNHPLIQSINKIKEKNISITDILVKAFAIKETTQMISQVLIEKEENVLPLAVNLQEKAKGNPFFTLELLRTLVEEKIVYLQDNRYTFDLGKLNAASLPENIIEVVLKRVEAMPADDLQVLSYASVMGKEIKFQLLTELIQKPLDEVLNSIENGLHSQLVYRDITGKENIFFMHDRIREAFYQRVPAQEKAPLHRRIGQVLEEQAGGNTAPILYDLAYHFTQGQLEDKALEYSIPAAHKAQDSYANALAISLYNSAKQILEKQNRTNAFEYIDVLENLGEAYRMAGRFDNSIQSLKTCESLIPQKDKIRRAQVLAKMGDAVFEKGDMEESTKIIEQALRILNFKPLLNKAVLMLGLSKEFNLLLLHTWFPKIFVSQKYKGTEKDLLIIRLTTRLIHSYYFFDTNKMFYMYLVTYNLSERIGPCSELARSYYSGGAVWITFPWFSRAFRDCYRGLKITQELGDRINEGCAYSYITYTSYVANKPLQAIEAAPKAISLLKGLGEYWELGLGYAFFVHSSCISGRFNDGVRYSDEFLAIMREINALQTLEWALFNRVKLDCLRGEISNKLIDMAQECLDITIKLKDKTSIMYTLALKAFVHLKLGEYKQAIKHIDESIRLFPTHFNKGTWSLEIFPMGAEVYLDAYMNASDLSEQQKKDYLQKAGSCLKQAFNWGKNFKFFLGWAYQAKGTYNWLVGKKKDAIRIWEEGIKYLRENTEDKYRLGRILLEEATFLLQDNPNDKKALEYLLESKELFIQSGCQIET